MAAVRELNGRLAPAEMGCLYLDAQGIPTNPQPKDAAFKNLTRHYGRIEGAWPTLGE